jgi:hypothetical protein
VHGQMSSLLRNELSSLRNGNTLGAVCVLASHIYELQVQEAGELTHSCLGCVHSPTSISQSEPSVIQSAFNAMQSVPNAMQTTPSVMQSAPSVTRTSVSISYSSFTL